MLYNLILFRTNINQFLLFNLNDNKPRKLKTVEYYILLEPLF